MKIKTNLKQSGIIVPNKLSDKTMNSILSKILYPYTLKTSKEKYYYNIPSIVFSNITNNYRKYIDSLKLQGVIDVNEKYSTGYNGKYYFTKSYKITETYKEKIVIDKIIFNKKDWDKVINKDEDDNLRKKYFLQSSILENNYKKLKINTDIDKEYYKNGEVKFIKYISNKKNLYDIKNNKLYFKWKSERLYTRFAFCSSNVRLNNFKFDDDNLATIDIPNSFPLFLTKWMHSKGLNKKDSKTIEWIKLVEQGRDMKGISYFYTDLMNKINNLFKDDEEITLKDAKRYFLIWLNGKEKNDKYNNTFKILYPEIYKIVDKNKYKMYNEIVKLETEFIMNDIVKQLYYDIKDIKIITCHDQIYFQEKYKQQVKEIWDSKINEIY